MMTRPTARRRLLSLALAAALSGPVLAQNYEPFTVSDIRVDGLQRISAGTVFTYLPIETRRPARPQPLHRGHPRAVQDRLLQDIKLDRQGNILVVTVVERPAINTLTLEGNKELKTEDLMKGLKGIGLAEGETYNPLNLDRVTQELTRQYNNRGKYSVDIAPDRSPRSTATASTCSIMIAEGKAAKIRHINIVGNQIFPDDGHPPRAGNRAPATGCPGTAATTSTRARSFPATWKSFPTTTSIAATSISTSSPPRSRSARPSRTCSSPRT